MHRKMPFSIHDDDLICRKWHFPIHETSIMYRIYEIMKQQKMASKIISEACVELRRV
ncbi:hypothetical protein SAMN06265348_109160 [Pedobacter westerhofensis]|uniref:Uncharacterized protein n=1 Tax=Pedobacter westerhofensis TaxID=425512 RepID=A0A521EUW2_9SPHI|nr:hypothetical protein SAMN06265348_109160 [Pedobacter westerhofensis]